MGKRKCKNNILVVYMFIWNWFFVLSGVNFQLKWELFMLEFYCQIYYLIDNNDNLMAILGVLSSVQTIVFLWYC